MGQCFAVNIEELACHRKRELKQSISVVILTFHASRPSRWLVPLVPVPAGGHVGAEADVGVVSGPARADVDEIAVDRDGKTVVVGGGGEVGTQARFGRRKAVGV